MDVHANMKDRLMFQLDAVKTIVAIHVVEATVHVKYVWAGMHPMKKRRKK